MSLLIGVSHSKSYVHVIECDDWWKGQMKHYIWLETHNEDVDYHYTDADMEPHD